MLFRKIFSRIKKEYIIDGIIGLVVLFSLFVFLKSLSKKTTYVDVMIKVMPEKWYLGEPAPPNWYVLSLRKGDKEIDGFGRTVAEIIDVKVFGTGGLAKVLYLKTRLYADYIKKTNTYQFKYKPLQLNLPIELSLGSTNISGMVVQINDFPKLDIEKYLIVTVKIYDRHPWYADAIKIGDKFTSEDEVLAEVIDRKVELAERSEVILGRVADGTILPRVLDSLKRDITLKIKIKVRREIDNDWVFRTDQLVKVGNELNIPINNNVNLFNANVLSIEETDGAYKTK